MREGGLVGAIEDLGLSVDDRGDIDFGEVAPDEHHPIRDHAKAVARYKKYLSQSTSVPFSAWKDPAPSTDSDDEPHEAPQDSPSNDAHASSLGKRARSDETTINVVNAELQGAGLKLVRDEVAAALAGGGSREDDDTSGAETTAPPPFILTVGGDHSIASGSIAALCHHHGPDLGVVWVDAHADANTPRTSPSGHYHGMPAAHLLGWFDREGELGDAAPRGAEVPGFAWFPKGGCLPEHKLAYVGLRDIDPEEGRMLRSSGVRVFTMRDVDKHGIARVIEMAIDAVSDAHKRCPVHLSLDIDAVDPVFAPGTGTCARGGLTFREIHYLCEDLALTNRLVSMDLVEVNPGLEGASDVSAMHGDNPAIHSSSQTVRLAIELVLSALGKQIM